MKWFASVLLAVTVGACAHVPTVGPAALMTGAGTLDLHSTFACRGCVERNPVSALLYDPHHQAWLYAGNYALIGGVTLWTAALHRRKSPLWWVPTSLVTAAYLYSWRHNRGVAAALDH